MMAVPTLRQICILRLAEDLVKDGYGCVSLENRQSFVLGQLDQGAWGSESLAILDRAVKYFNFTLTPRVILALLPSNTKSLSMKECPLLTEGCLNAAIERCFILESLDLTENTGLNFSCVDLFGTVFFERNKTLTAVILEDCLQVNNAHIQALLLNAPNLQHLNIARCDITDTVFLLNEQKQLAREACFQIKGLTSEFDSKLQTVDVSRCEEFSSTGVRHLCTLCGPTLQNINLSWTKVDCTALLYLSGMGLPHAVQFYLSTSSMNSSTLESLVYTLHQFDAMCEDIADNWTSKDRAEEYLVASTESEDITSQIITESSLCEGDESQNHVVSLHDIQPTLGDDAEENLGRMDVDANTNMPSCSNENRSQPATLSNTDTVFSDHAIDSEGSSSKTKDTSSCEKSLSPNLFDIDIRTECEKENDAKNEAPVPDCSTHSFPDSQGAVTFQGYHEEDKISPLDLPSSSPVKEEEFSCGSMEKNELDSVNITNDKEVKTASDIVEHSDVAQSSCDNGNLKCDTLEKDNDGNIIQSTENEDIVFTLNRSTSELAFEQANDSYGKESAPTCDEKFLSSTGELLHLDVNTEVTSAINGDQHDALPVTSQETKEASRLQRGSLGSKMKMDFAPNICSIQMNGVLFKEINTGILCLQTFLKSNENLHSLTLYGGMTGSFVTDLILDLIGHYSHKLTYLSIEGCDQVTNIGATAIAKNCKQLATLDLTGVPFLGDPGIIHLLRSLSLSHLLMAETQITGLSLDAMSAMPYVSELKELDLSWCEEIAGETSLNQLLTLCSSLKRLMLRETPLTANTLSLIAENCHNITELSIASNMSNVSDESVCLLSENLPLLENIDLSWNSHLTDKCIHSLFKNCCHLWNANLEGLKRMTSSAFVPIIVVPDELKDFLAKHGTETNSVCNSHETGIKFEILPCLPHRSTTYCTRLRAVNLKYSDFVEDVRLQELVTVTQGGIKVIDYYGEEVEGSKSSLENLLKQYLSSADVR